MPFLRPSDMKIPLAILITLGLLAACYVISALLWLDFFWILIPVTSLWAALDSKRIELHRYKLGISCRPVAMFCGCYLLWIVVFPWYLWARLKIKEGTAPLKTELLGNPGPIRRFFRRISPGAERVGEWSLIFLFSLQVAFLLFCIEESWRGKHVWEHYQQEAAAKGEILDWNALIPPPVLDSQNVFGVPMMSVWFVKQSSNNVVTEDLRKRLIYPGKAPQVLIAEVSVKSPDALLQTDTTNLILQLEDSGSHQKTSELFEDTIGISAFGAVGSDTLIVRLLNTNQIKPLHIIVEARGKVNARDLNEFLSGNSSGNGPLHVQMVGTNSFRVLTSFCPAADYLNWSDQFQSDFDVMRDALKRPYARMNGDYRYPPTVPLPNFVNVRIVSQTLAQRAQCYLLLGQPDKALAALTLLDELRRMLENPPTGKPMTMVSAMINIAVTGLYVDVIADGFRLHAWREPQLIVLQRQLEHIDLGPYVKEAFHEEEVGMLQTFQVAMANAVENKRVPNANVWQRIKNWRPAFGMWGFYYFNMVNIVRMDQMGIDTIDTAQNTISPEKAAASRRAIHTFDHAHPWQIYRLLALIAVPDFTRALQTFAYNQTRANQAQIVCALEHYRLAHGVYPEKLTELQPQFIDKLPHDLIGGQPLKYQRQANGQFWLYSVGWNEVDEGEDVSLFPYARGVWNWQ